MQLNWSTFLLEIVNFAILVWILKRFLYKPVLDIIARRREAVEKITAAANATRAESETLKGQYERRLGDWEREKDKAREALQQELDDLRQRRLAEVEAEVAAAKERARVNEARHRQAARDAGEREALTLAASFATRLLTRLASPALDAGLAAAALGDLKSLPADKRAAIGDVLRGVASARVTSATPLAEPTRDAVRGAMRELAGDHIDCEFEEDPALLAGIRIVAGPWILHDNLLDGLEGFADVARNQGPS